MCIIELHLHNKIRVPSVDWPIISFYTPDAMIGFKDAQYTVEEGNTPMVNVCAIVQHPQVSCGINFPFSFTLQTSNGTAGID